MKKYLNFSFFIFHFSLLLAMAGCVGDGGVRDEGYGTLDLSSITVSTQQSATRAATRAVDISGFAVRIFSGERLVAEWSDPASVPEIYPMRPGSYTLEISSPALPPAAWETPWYVGSRDFEIRLNDTTSVGSNEDPVVCTLGNIKVTVVYDDLLHALLGADANVTVSAAGSTLDYGRDEARAGYFRAPDSGTMTVRLEGMVGGKLVILPPETIDVAPGDWKEIEYSIDPEEWTIHVVVSGEEVGDGSKIGQIGEGEPWF